MIIPDTVKVGGYVYKVIRDKKLAKLNGEANHEKLTIHLDKGLLKQVEEGTFIHEILHVVDSVFNNNSLTEAQVERLSEGLYQVIKEL